MWTIWGVGVVVVLLLTSRRVMGEYCIKEYIGPWVLTQPARYVAALFWIAAIPTFLIILLTVYVILGIFEYTDKDKE